MPRVPKNLCRALMIVIYDTKKNNIEHTPTHTQRVWKSEDALWTRVGCVGVLDQDEGTAVLRLLSRRSDDCLVWPTYGSTILPQALVYYFLFHDPISFLETGIYKSVTLLVRISLLTTSTKTKFKKNYIYTETSVFKTDPVVGPSSTMNRSSSRIGFNNWFDYEPDK